MWVFHGDDESRRTIDDFSTFTTGDEGLGKGGRAVKQAVRSFASYSVENKVSNRTNGISQDMRLQMDED